MKLFGVQTDIVWEDRAANHARVRELLDGAEIRPGSLVALPEMFASGFSMNVAAIAESEARETAAFLAELARERGITVAGGLVSVCEGARGRNEAAVYAPEGREIARYHKMQPFAFGEQQHYAAGGEIALFEWQGFTVAPFICYDLRFPELFRRAARRGAELFVVIANWPEARIGHWVTLLQARAIENQAYVLGVNRTGRDPQLNHTGRSLVVDFGGSVLADAGETECVFGAEVDRNALLAYRQKLPFLKDMRPELVG
jgi:predicted amidohydrolase